MATNPAERFRTPAAPLAGFVDKLWLYEAEGLPHARERILPDGSMTLVVNLADDEVRHYGVDGACVRLRGVTLHGAQAAPFVIDTAEQHRVMGVHFVPGGAYPFFGVPAAELRGRHVSLADLWGDAADSLRCELLEARDPERRFDALERALLRRCAAPRRHAGMLATLRALASPGCEPARIGALEERLGVSRKVLARRFDAEVGLAPKRLARILRFQRALARFADPRGAASLAELALACGYYDEAHLARDCRELAATTPGAILAAGGTRANHLALAR